MSKNITNLLAIVAGLDYLYGWQSQVCWCEPDLPFPEHLSFKIEQTKYDLGSEFYKAYLRDYSYYRMKADSNRTVFLKNLPGKQR